MAPRPEDSVTSQLDDYESRAERNEEEADEEMVDVPEAVQLGSVDSDGNVVDLEGNILGKVDGEVPKGSMVDEEGDVLDAEGNIIGSAKSVKRVGEDMNGAAEDDINKNIPVRYCVAVYYP